jgi:anti-sigma factor RsiW
MADAIQQQDSASKSFLDFITGVGNAAARVVEAIRAPRDTLVPQQTRREAEAQVAERQATTRWLIIGGLALAGVIVAIVLLRK